MRLKDLLSPLAGMDVQAVKTFLDTHTSDKYRLLDVRQPGEYQAGHLPGARLIPLKELPERLEELDRDLPVIVYCASGRRSRAAAQLLTDQGFREVYNLEGGLKAWSGRLARGPEEVGLELFTGQEEYPDGAALAYAMEDGLQRFYQRLADQAEDAQRRKLYQRLALFEEGHKARLQQRLRKKTGQDLPPELETGLMEGGRRLEQFLARAKALVQSLPDILEMAMALEVQAFDLYSRMADRSRDAETRALFRELAEEEKKHLRYLDDQYGQLV